MSLSNSNPYGAMPEQPKKKKGGCLKWGATGAAILVAIGIFSGGENDSASDSNSTGFANDTIVAAPEQVADEKQPIAADAPAADQDSNDADVPAEFNRAARKAHTYVTTMHMSKQGVFEQLTSEFEKYTPEAAQYAVDNLDVDFNEVALKKADNYSNTMHMSKQGLYDQLISFAEGFTEAEAQYAIDNLETDYNRNALEKAKSYQDMDMSLDGIYGQLTSFAEGFTAEEAQYAVDNLPE